MLANIALDRPLAVLDLEATGVDTKTDRIVEISVPKLVPDGAHVHTTRRINPGKPIPPEASAVHGIYDHDVCDLPGFEKYARGVVKHLDGCDLCGFNILGFDLRLLLAEFARCDVIFPMKGRRVIDVQEIFHRMNPRNLAAAYKHYCGREHEGAHGAAADVLATALILDAQVARHEGLPRTVGELHDHLRDPAAVDMGEMFVRDGDGVVVLAKGKHRGLPLAHAAKVKRDYLEWMLTSDFFPDTKEIVQEALNGRLP